LIGTALGQLNEDKGDEGENRRRGGGEQERGRRDERRMRIIGGLYLYPKNLLSPIFRQLRRFLR
jgi:hypothetical protein